MFWGNIAPTGGPLHFVHMAKGNHIQLFNTPHSAEGGENQTVGLSVFISMPKRKQQKNQTAFIYSVESKTTVSLNPGQVKEMRFI